MDCRIISRQLFPGVHHFTDRMGMHCTLIAGENHALLFDTGYGFDDLKAAIQRITMLPYHVILSHGHHDHACGNFQFDQVFMDEKEIPICEKYAGGWRSRVWGQALDKGLDLSDWDEEDFFSAGCGKMIPIKQKVFDLGGLTAQVIFMPGHTPGSIGLYIPEHRLLLCGDNFNPTTWLFFQEAMPMAAYGAALEKMLALPFAHVLCPHWNEPLDRCVMEDFCRGINKEKVSSQALPQPALSSDARVYGYAPGENLWFCFDADKLPDDWKEALMENHPWPG